ncbi:protein transport protein Sec61 subunit alpha-like [Tasmannia lanceolata]|uniref:protein transport protein Sec61 subunit alpha-like n=1 Tax=Tasmannia lanceolata TaxID=3420 RepID=UPI004063BA69
MSMPMSDSNIHNYTDRNGGQKLLSILIAIGGAVLYGMYGSVSQVGAGNAILIILQLSFGSFIVIILDELLQKGCGCGIRSSMNLFVATNICKNIVFKFAGFVIALFHLLLTRTDMVLALREAFVQQCLADIAANPFQALFYLVFTLSVCASLSKSWFYARGAKEEQTVARRRESDLMKKRLKGYIPIVAIWGAMYIGALIMLPDYRRAIGSGTGIVICDLYIYQFLRVVFDKRERYN